jgi:hypothetical protein
MTTAITEYSPIEAALAGIEKYRGIVFDVATQQGMVEAKAAHREVAAPRIALEKVRTKLKADVLERGRQIDGEAKRIGALFAAIEDPIKEQIARQERCEEEARQAAIRAEQERIEAEARAKKEAEERLLAQQRDELARQRAALEAEQRKAAEAERARREAVESEERERRGKIEADEAAARRRIREEEDKARAVREIEETRLRAERKRLEDEQRAQDAEKRRQQDLAEAAEREVRRQQNELSDARTMLDTFRKRFRHRPEFALVLEAIDECLEAA